MNGQTNKLLRLFNFSEDYSKSLQNFGWALIQLNLIIVVFFFWFIIFTYYEPYQSIAFLMIKFIRISVFLFILGFLIHYLSYFLYELTYKRAMKKINLVVK